MQKRIDNALKRVASAWLPCQRAAQLTCVAGLLCLVGLQAGARRLKVLAIGNSFSQDAVEQYLWELAASQGDTLTIGNAYIGGCSIDRHWQNAQTDAPAYKYRKVVGGQRTERDSSSLGFIVADEPWDVITMQQVSQLSGDTTSYGSLPLLIGYVRQTFAERYILPAQRSRRSRRQQDRVAADTVAMPELMWHLTWAYPQHSKSGPFRTVYHGDQQTMYRRILEAADHELPLVGIRRRIPSGIAVQRARRALGDVLNRDDIHLSLGEGRYTAACTWCEMLTGGMVLGNAYRPAGMSVQTARLLQSAAHKAVMNDSLGWNDSLRVLWLGTRGTFYADVPLMLQRLAGEARLPLSLTTRLKRSSAPGAFADDGLTQQLLAQGCWDYVLIQEPAAEPDDMLRRAAHRLFPYDRSIDMAVMSGSPDARIIYFNTWGQHGDCYPVDYPMQRAETQSLQLQLNATRPHATAEWTPLRSSQWAAGVGHAWRRALLRRPDITLYDKRRHRPTTEGSYLTACVLLRAMTGQTVSASYTAGLPLHTARALQQLAAD